MLTEKIGNLIMPQPKKLGIWLDAKNSMEDEISNSPIIQRNAFAYIIEPDKFKNAYSPENSEGDFNALYRFSVLADKVPSFTRYYNASETFIEQTYCYILDGANCNTDPIRKQFSSAKKKFEDSKLEALGGTPATFHPVYADPDDWYESKNFDDIKIDLTNEEEIQGLYRIISAKKELGLPDELIDNSLGNRNEPQKLELDPKTKLNSIKLKFKEVKLRRNWLDFNIFKSSNWYIEGEKQGYFSSGNIEKNSGIMPLVTSSILLAMDVKIDGEYAGDDENKIKENKNLSYGPFQLNNKIQIFGWISSLVPLSPKSSG